MSPKPEIELEPGLYIVATPIGNMGDITLRALETLRKVDFIACEDTRESGKLTSAYDIKAQKLPYHDHNAAEMRPKILRILGEGKTIALISDAGMPLVSDPGYKLVQDCIAAGHYVTCVPGASATLNALVLSGLPADRFFFAGFLPAKQSARRQALGELKEIPGTLIFYETGPRLQESLADMKDILGDRNAAVARELTKKFEELRRDRLSALAASYEGEPPKGEIVVVVGAGFAEAAAWDDAAIDALLTKMIEEEGMGVKDASSFVATKAGLRKNDVYQRALLLKGRRK
jgi:16S rRNA (cytidine1402-2'-O)-methyltransferase